MLGVYDICGFELRNHNSTLFVQYGTFSSLSYDIGISSPSDMNKMKWNNATVPLCYNVF